MLTELFALLFSLNPGILPVTVDYTHETVVQKGCAKALLCAPNYDGDTLWLRTEFRGYSVPLTVRIKSIDSPEIKGSCPAEKELARAAKLAVETMLKSATKVELVGVEEDLDDNDRLLTDVVVDGRDIGQALINATPPLARPWTGRRESWCP